MIFFNTFCSVLLGFDTDIAPMEARRNGPLVTFFLRYLSGVVALDHFHWGPMEDQRLYSVEMVRNI